jgi:hypothetical protein
MSYRKPTKRVSRVKTFLDAMAAVKRDEEGAAREADLRTEIRRLMIYDAEAAIDTEVSLILRAGKRCGGAPTRQLCFEGMPAIDYEETRYIDDGEGRGLLMKECVLKWYGFHRARCDENEEKIIITARRVRDIEKLFRAWTEAQFEKGITEAKELTFEKFAEATGVLRAKRDPPIDDDEGEDE